MTREFIPNLGHRLTNEGRSIILSMALLGKLGITISDRQIITMSEITSKFLDAIEPIDRLPFINSKIAKADNPILLNKSAYKFTDDEGLSHWMRGSIRLNPPAKYLKIENLHSRDAREGRGLICLQGKDRFSIFTSTSGFNSLILCTSSNAWRSERTKRMKKFGRNIIKIRDVNEFACRIAELSGATDFSARDVTYSDAKTVKGFSIFPDEWARHFGTGDLSDSYFDFVTSNYLDEFIRLTAPGSIFTKSFSYRGERERRISFSFPQDMVEPISVTDPSLAEMVEHIC